jgi:hypothetical protein
MCFIRALLLAGALFLPVLPAKGGEDVVLNDANVLRLPGGLRSAVLALPVQDLTLPLVAPSVSGAGPALLRSLDAKGVANGFAGILYDNRDRGHSSLDPALFPRLARLAYGFELVADNADYGPAGSLLLSPVVFGNSSTAITSGAAPRSLPRHAMTSPGGPEAQARLYADNDIYVYPEHRDHDSEDRYPANWPYMIISQGSSGSDQPFLEAIAMTLAAFPPPTFARMRDQGLVAPTLQAILRQSLASVEGAEDYLSGRAHPVVFDATLLRPDRMVAAAAAMGPDDIPPVGRLTVEEEDFATTAGLLGRDERLFDTPHAIARIWRSPAWEREMILSAEAVQPEGRPVAFTWHLLNGLPDRVDISPLDEEGSRARIRVRWHDPFAVAGPDAARMSSRVDIGVFATAGGATGAPAIFSISFPSHEVRTYGSMPSGNVGLLAVDYDAINRWAYFDPILHWSAPWSDVAVRDGTGAITGWTRTYRDGTSAAVPATMTYRLDRSRPDQPELAQVTGAP